MPKFILKRASFITILALHTHFAFGQSTLPPNVFTQGTLQVPLTVNAGTQKKGNYGYIAFPDKLLQNPDTSANNYSSDLRLFEIWPDGSTKELGLAHSFHDEISALGGGRFSHWHSTKDSSEYILFSPSDATDPRTNGRNYLAVQPFVNATTDLVDSTYDSQTKIKKYYLETTSPDQRTIVISNSSNSSYTFNLAFNQNGFLQSSGQLKEEIQNMIPDFAGDSLERKIWNFVRTNHTWEIPYSGERWHHHPLLMFNSAGWGFCDDAAAVLMHTAALFGISGRVWGLHGHVVPELFTNGSWHMYDPTYQTYFLDSITTGNVASVSSLISNHSLITSPLNLAPLTTFTQKLKVAGDESEEVSTSEYANLYSPDDVYSSWYNLVPVTEIPLVFNLPPRGTIEIGAHNLNDAPSIVDGDIMGIQENYSSVKVSLPQGSRGDLSVFLIPYMIKGNGTVTLYFADNTNQTISIPSVTDWNQFDPSHDGNKYVKSISYQAGNGGMVIHYLANPIRSSVKTFNSVILKPANATSTRASNPLVVRFNVAQ